GVVAAAERRDCAPRQDTPGSEFSPPAIHRLGDMSGFFRP
ncbi:MAG: hypothetical protein JWM91_3043, partial [Rhodospirillales bacterium]|nr:hypothetical protein [Rhodospirillales bacterium]